MLLARLQEEVDELKDIFKEKAGLDVDLDLVRKEAADVANFAMMIADNV